ncbi:MULTISPECIES: helix-turn-helix transcriptional regulator [unclassified Pseudactinotalea]|uniref:helix-turn-helix transcriptional regulator n=1 Tax=Micrococcales TaxID=85006 RepID=UPI003C7AD443
MCVSEQASEIEESTRERVLNLVVQRGPVRAADLASELALTSAAIRRHLIALESEGQIRVRPESPLHPRGRGRPAKRYIATAEARPRLDDGYSRVALMAIEQLRDRLGDEAVEQFADRRADEMVGRYRQAVEAAGQDPADRARMLADLLSADGYAASTRPVGANLAIQLCQGHCPVHAIAAQYPQMCESETRAFSELLGVHVQRLATLAGGEHVCTTHVPPGVPQVSTPSHHDDMEGNS